MIQFIQVSKNQITVLHACHLNKRSITLTKRTLIRTEILLNVYQNQGFA